MGVALLECTMPTEYYFKHVRPEVYELAKFDYSKQPVAIYTIRKMRCDCFAALRYNKCKHIDMLKGFISGGRKPPAVCCS